MPKDHLGNVYPSITAMANKYGINCDVLMARLKRGWNLEAALTTPTRKRKSDVCYDHLGNQYPNYKAMAEAYGINYSSLNTRLRAGWSIEQALNRETDHHSQVVCYDRTGKKYPSKAAIARAYGINEKTLQGRLQAGQSLDEALTKNHRAVKDHLGNTYVSKTAMLKAYGVHQNTFNQRIAAGASLEDALTAKSNSLRIVDGEYRLLQDNNGNKYRNLPEMCNTLGISVSAYHDRKRQGIPIDKPNRIHPVTDHLGNEYPTLQTMLDVYKIKGSTYRGRIKSGWTPEECLLGRKKKKEHPSKGEIIESARRLKNAAADKRKGQK